jgi:PIN domain nuclease of toxin-antitoxin system
MTVVLDAYAVIAALTGERAASKVQPLVATGLVCAPNVAEVVDVCVRVHANEVRTVCERIGWLISGGLEVVALDAELAMTAGSLRARYYRRRRCEISHGDCCALALAEHRQIPLVTADPDLAAVARADGVQIVALPDLRGRRP